MDKVDRAEREARVFSNAAAACGGLAAALGGIALLGWITGLRGLASLNPNYLPMSPDTAAAFIAIGLTLVAFGRRSFGGRMQVFAGVIIALVSVYGLLKLVEYPARIDLTFENLLFPITEQTGAFPLRRMSPITGTLLFISGTALILMLRASAKERARDVVAALGLAVFGVGFVATTGYAYGTPLLYGSNVIPLAATSAIAFLLVGIGLVAAAGPTGLFVRPFVGPSVRAKMLRAFLPLTAGVVWLQSFFDNALADSVPVNGALISAGFSLIFVFSTATAVTLVARVIARALDRAEMERKRTEEELLKFQLGFDRSGEAIFLTDLNGTITYVNPAFETIYGYSREEAIGKTPRILKSGQLSPESYDRFWSALLAKQVVKGEIVNKGKEGQLLTVESCANPILNDAGEIIGFLSIQRDITERKRAEEELAREQYLLNTLTDNITDHVYFKDSQSRFIRINGAHAKAFGLTDPAEAVGKTDFDFFTDEHARTAYEDELRIMRTGQPIVDAVEKQTWPDRADTWVSTTKMPLRDQTGSIVGTFGVSRNITDRKRTEEALRLAEEKYRSIFDYAVEGIFQSTAQGRFVTVNSALARMWGYASPQELISSVTDIAHQVYTDPEQRAEFRRQIEEQGEVQGFEFQVTRKDGSVMWVSENARAVRDPRGELLYYEGTTQDITARKQAEEALHRRADEFAALYDIAHDLALQLDLATLLQTIVDRAASLLAAPGGGIYLVDTGQGDLNLVASKGSELTVGSRLRIGEGLAGLVAQTRQAIMLDDYSRWEHRAQQYEGIPIAAVVQVPMLYGGDLIGVLAVHQLKSTARTFTDADVRLLSLFAGQAAGAVHTARLLAMTIQRANELAGLQDVTRDLATHHDLPTLLQTIVERATTLLGTPCAFLYLYDPAQQNLELRLTRGVSVPLGTRLALGEGMAGRVAQSYQPLIVDDYQTWEQRSRKYDGMAFSAILEVPMHYGGELIGVLAVNEMSPTHRKFTETDARLLSLFAGQAASAVNNARLHSAEREQRKFVETLREIGTMLTSQRDPDAVFGQLLELVGRVVPFDSAVVLLLEGSVVRCKRQRGYDQLGLADWMKRFEMPLNGLASLMKIAETGKPYVSMDTYADPNWTVLEATRNIRSWVGAPITIRGTLIGFLGLDKMEPGFYTDQMAERLAAFATQAGLALENARLYATQQKLAITDGLTGLFNRRHFMELAEREFHRAQRQGSQCGALMIDLDNFKSVNDTFGHSAGDGALRMIAKTLAESVREIDIVARYGGDEFVILLPECELGQARQIAERIEQNGERLKVSNENQIAVLGFSVGAAVSTLAPEDSLEKLLARADAEMYFVKQNHKLAEHHLTPTFSL